MIGRNLSAHGLYKEFVSHGYIVFALDHMDESCGYTERENGTPVHFARTAESNTHESRFKMIKIRESEISAVIDEISEEGFLQNKLGFPDRVRLDMSKLIVSGHSFGGGTTLGVTAADSRVTASIPSDPWLWPYHKDINALVCTTPTFIIRAETWYEWLRKR